MCDSVFIWSHFWLKAWTLSPSLPALLFFFLITLRAVRDFDLAREKKNKQTLYLVYLKINLRSIKIESEAASEQQAPDQRGGCSLEDRHGLVVRHWLAVLYFVLLLYKYISKLWNELRAVWLLWHDQTNLPILSCLLFFLTFLWPRGFPIQEP